MKKIEAIRQTKDLIAKEILQKISEDQIELEEKTFDILSNNPRSLTIDDLEKMSIEYKTPYSKFAIENIKEREDELNRKKEALELKMKLKGCSKITLRAHTEDFGSYGAGEAIIGMDKIEITEKGAADGGYIKYYLQLLEKKYGKGPYNIENLEDYGIIGKVAEILEEDIRGGGFISIETKVY